MTEQIFDCDAIVVVDLDGTLIQSDMLVENVFLFLRHRPLQFFMIFVWLLGGKAHLKARLADAILPSTVDLPYTQELIAWLIQRKQSGTKLVLATASDIRIAKAVSDHLGIFDEVLGSVVGVNLSSTQKQRVLVERFGHQGFEYVGNSKADYAVWRSASLIHVANPDAGVLNTARSLGVVGEVFDNRPPYFKKMLKALRVHQWTKNLLIFVPLLASHRLAEVGLWASGALAFLVFGACASSVYLLNDLLDLQDDRRHPSKCKRPLAAGTFPILHALVLMPALLIASFGLAAWLLPVRFGAVLVSYYVLTLLYSLWLKRVVMLDVVTLAMLYTVRVVSGAAAMGLVATFWILAFCVFIFLSLAFVKRYTELCDARQKGLTEQASGRGYYPADFELLASLGSAAGYISVLVLALYINEAASSTLYLSPQWMWAACPLLLFWLSRVWLLAHRGQMHDDPIVFALRDKASRWIGAAFVLVFTLASLA